MDGEYVTAASIVRVVEWLLCAMVVEGTVGPPYRLCSYGDYYALYFWYWPLLVSFLQGVWHLLLLASAIIIRQLGGYYSRVSRRWGLAVWIL